LELLLPIPVNEEKNTPFDNPNAVYGYENPHVKTFLLFQAHLSRVQNFDCTDYHTDRISVLDQSVRVIQAMIDVSVNQGYYKTTMGLISLLQCTKQALWAADSTLLILPHLTRKDVTELVLNGEAINDIQQLAKVSALQARLLFETSTSLSRSQVADICKVLQNLPFVSVSYEIEGLKDKEGRWFLKPSTEYALRIRIILPSKGSVQLHAPHFPKSQTEGWFVLVGNERADELWALKRVSSESRNSLTTSLQFMSPYHLGQHDFDILVVSDGYVGINATTSLKLAVI
jgi:Sec63 Brl domain